MRGIRIIMDDCWGVFGRWVGYVFWMYEIMFWSWNTTARLIHIGSFSRIMRRCLQGTL